MWPGDSFLNVKDSYIQSLLVDSLSFSCQFRDYFIIFQLTAHMQDLLTAAYTKFETWQARRARKS